MERFLALFDSASLVASTTGDKLASAADHEAVLHEQVAAQEWDLKALEDAANLREEGLTSHDEAVTSREKRTVKREDELHACEKVQGRPKPCRLGASSGRTWSARRPLTALSICNSCGACLRRPCRA